MQIEEFALERVQSLYENTVEVNLSDSGVHPYSLRELLTPEECEALLDIELGYGWTNGAEELRDAIAALYRDRSRDEVIVTNGSAEANFLLATTVLERGDEAVVVVPNYLQIHGWAKAMGVDVKTVALRESLGWRPDLDEVEAAITAKTRLISVCNPNNPTGSLLAPEDCERLIALARRHGVYLHADEVYKGSELAEDEPPSLADLYEKAIVTNGMSKAMALPGLRIGWLVGPAEEIYGAWQRKDYTSITTTAVSEFVAERVLAPARRARILDRSKSILRKNLATLEAWVAEHQRFSLTPPRAGGMAFVAYDLPIGSTEFADRLRNDESVLVAPGDVYGLDRYIRIGIGAPHDHIEHGLERLANCAERIAAS